MSELVRLTAPDFAAHPGGAPAPCRGEGFTTRVFASETAATDWNRAP